MYQEITEESHPFNYNIDEKSNYDYTLNTPDNTYKRTNSQDTDNIYNNYEYEFYQHSKYINEYGSISPHGPILDTPDMIKLPLKLHQKRTLYHMSFLENHKNRIIDDNFLILSDNVGSGKSYCILSLIAMNRTVNMYNNLYKILPKYNSINTNFSQHQLTGIYMNEAKCIEFNSNLIVVPHSIYTQWYNYINSYTTIPFIGLSTLLEINKLGNSKEKLIETLNSVYIILVKSTVYNDFIRYLESYNLRQEIRYKSVNTEFGLEDKYVIEYGSNNDIDECKYVSSHFDSMMCRTYIMNKYESFVNDSKKDFDKAFNSFSNFIISQNKEYTLSKNDTNINNIGHCKGLTIIQGFIFQRIIFDEADSIKIPSCSHYIGKMTWFITSSFQSLLFDRNCNFLDKDTNQLIRPSNGITGCSLINRCFKDTYWASRYKSIDKSFRIFSTIIRNHPEFVKVSIDIPRPQVNMVRCYTPISFNAVQNALGQDILKALNAGDINEASSLLGYEIKTEDDIIDSVTMSLNNKKNELSRSKLIKLHESSLLEQERITLKNEYERLKELYKDIPVDERPDEFNDTKKNYYSINNRILNIKKTIENNENEINDIDSKIKNIVERLENPTAKTCPICMDNIQVPCIVICCKNLFCIDCIQNNIKTRKTCPLCREKIDNSKLHIIKDEEKKEIDNTMSLLDKLDIISEYLLDNRNKRILIFSEYERTFELIEKRLTQLGITHSRIMGNTLQINKTINEYKNNRIQVLMLNAKYFGAGINLQMTDEIFVYHRMSNDLEKQVIGRAQRLGRTDALNIHYLCYDNEYNINSYNENIGQNTNHIIEQYE
jgi:hypothetical protein